MSVGAATTHLEFEFYEFEYPEPPDTPQPFTVNGDGSVDLDLSGNAIFRNDVDVKEDLFVQDVNILEEINSIKEAIGLINQNSNTILSSLDS